jgi:hypothetical protein
MENLYRSLSSIDLMPDVIVDFLIGFAPRFFGREAGSLALIASLHDLTLEADWS